IAWQHWQGWVNALFGLWLGVAPWALDIDNGAAVANLPLVGAAAVVLSVWSATFGRRGDPAAPDGGRTPWAGRTSGRPEALPPVVAGLSRGGGVDEDPAAHLEELRRHTGHALIPLVQLRGVVTHRA